MPPAKKRSSRSSSTKKSSGGSGGSKPKFGSAEWFAKYPKANRAKKKGSKVAAKGGRRGKPGTKAKKK